MNKFKGLTSTLLLTGFMTVFSISVFAAEYGQRAANTGSYNRGFAERRHGEGGVTAEGGVAASRRLAESESGARWAAPAATAAAVEAEGRPVVVAPEELEAQNVTTHRYEGPNVREDLSKFRKSSQNRGQRTYY